MMQVNVEINYDPNLPEKFLTAIDRAFDMAAVDVGDAIFQNSQHRVNVKTGLLKKSGNVRYGKAEAEVGYNTPYARPVHFGSRPHGHHPGYKGNPYLYEAALDVMPQVEKLVLRNIATVLSTETGGET